MIIQVTRGYAGTGKTSSLLEDLKSHSGKKLVLAPTHKALGVIKERVEQANITRVWFKTIHSALGYRPVKRDKEVRFRPVKPDILHRFDVVFVDEASMLTEEMAEILDKSNKPVYLYGDWHQLPPVKEEQYKGDNIEEKLLTKVHRSDNILQKLFSENPGDRELIFKLLKLGLVSPGDLEYFDREEDIILSYRNKTVDFWNSLIRKKAGYKDFLEEGERIILLEPYGSIPRNEIIVVNSLEDYELVDVRIFPGKLVNDNIVVLSPKTQKEAINYAKKYMSKGTRNSFFKSFAWWKHGYAVTVHKSQGGQWRNVYVDLTDLLTADRKILNNLLYVALTRATNNTHIIDKINYEL